jgi:O-antigen/teichoic acid export membrane protein
VRRRLFRHSGLNFLGGAVPAVLVVVTSIVVSRTLGPSGTGRYAFAAFGMLIVSTLGTLGVPLVATRYVAEAVAVDDLARCRGISTALQRYAMALAALFAVGAVVLLLAGQTLGLTTPTFVMACAGVPPNIVSSLLGAVLTGQRRFGVSLLISAAGGVIQLVVVLAVAVCHPSVFLFVSSITVGTSVGCAATVYALRDLRRHGSGELPRQFRQTFWKDARSVSAIVVLDSLIFQRSEVFLLAAVSTSSQVAFFSLANSLVTRGVAFVPGALGGVLLPTFAGADDLEARVAVAMRWMALLVVPLGGLMVVTAPFVVRLLYGAPFAPMVPVVVITAVAATAISISTAGSSAMYATGGHRFILRVGLGCAILNVVLAILLIGPYGATGAAGAGALAQLVGVAGGVYLLRAKMRLRLPLWAVSKTIASAVGAGVVAALTAHAWFSGGVALVVSSLVFSVLFALCIVGTRTLPQDERTFVKGVARRFWRGGVRPSP